MNEPISADHLAAELERLGVPFLMPQGQPSEPLSPVDLLVGLAAVEDARLQLALIPLLLTRPDYAEHVNTAAMQLDHDNRVLLTCYYTAAMLLQRKHNFRPGTSPGEVTRLPDLFSQSLGLVAVGGVDDQLFALANRHGELSGEPINWLGTYEHGVRFLERQPDLDVV
jgi:hypothetical protein